MNLKNEFWALFICMLVVVSVVFVMCKQPVEPGPEPDPCAECPPKPCDPVSCEPCKKFNLTVRFSLGGNNSFPDIYLFERGGFPDEEITITSRDTTFTRVLSDYIGEPYGLRIVRGSGAKVVSSSVIRFECGEEI